MNALFFIITCLLVGCAPGVATRCSVRPAEMRTDWVTMQRSCRESIHHLTAMQTSASLQYLAMGAYFSRDVINRPGFSKLFFEGANEARENAIKLIEYLLTRGELTSEVSTLFSLRPPNVKAWANGAEALEHDLRLHSEITRLFKLSIETCGGDKSESSDNHLIGYLTAEFLDVEYKSIHDLAGKLSTLKKMLDRSPAVAEFIFDKKLLGFDI